SGLDKQPLAAIVDIQVAQYPPLRVQHKVVIASIRRQVAHIIGHHVVQPAHPVLADHVDSGSPAQRKDTAARAQSRQLLGGRAEAECGFHPVIEAGTGFSGSRPGIEYSMRNSAIFVTSSTEKISGA